MPLRRINLLLALLLLGGSCRGGCARQQRRPAGGALALLPAGASTVLHVDVAGLRSSGAGFKLLQLTAELPQGMQLLDELRTRAGLDPVRGLQSVTLALSEDAAASHRFAALLRADRFDEALLVGYAREQLQRRGDDLTPAKRGSRTLWTSRQRPDVAAFLVDAGTLAVAGGGWAEPMADLADEVRGVASLESRQDLLHLCERVGPGRHAWIAAVVPPATRAALNGDPRLAAAGSVSRVALGLGVPSTLEVELSADTATDADAVALAARLAETLREARRNPAILILGVGPYLDAVSARADGPLLNARLTLPAGQLEDLIGRLRNALRLAQAPAPPGFGR